MGFSSPPPKRGRPLLSRTVVGSPAATVDFTGFSLAYDRYQVEVSGLRPAVDLTALYIRVTEDGAVWKSGPSDYRYSHFNSAEGTSGNVGSSAASQIAITANAGIGAGESFNASFDIFNHASPTNNAVILGQSSRYHGTPAHALDLFGGVYVGAMAAIQGVRFQMSSGDIAAGIFSLFGVQGP